jgi:hypothetical protein
VLTPWREKAGVKGVGIKGGGRGVEVPKEPAGIHEKETYASPSSTSASSSPPASAKSSSSMSDMLIQGEDGQGRLLAVSVCELRWVKLVKSR